MTEAVRRCDKVEASCRCGQWADHDGPHVCDCGGSWTYDTDGRMEIVTFPGGDTDLFAALGRFLS